MSDASLKKYTLITVTVASFLAPFMGSAINLAIPSIGREYGAGTFLLSWVVISYLLASAAFLLPVGRLADLIGRRKIFVLGNVIFSAFSFLCGLAPNVKMLILFRLLQGAGSAMIFGTAMAILTSVFPPEARGRVLGINVAAVYTGLSLGPVLGGALNHNLGWQSIFYFSSLVGAVSFVFAFFKLKGEWVGTTKEKFDAPGAFLYSLGIIAFMYGVSSLTESLWAKYILFVGLVVIFFFILYEKRAKYPLLNLRLFSRNITFAFSNLAALINYSATFAVGYLLSLYLQSVKGFNSQVAGMILLSQPVMMALLSPLAGTLSDRIEPRKVASLGMLITALSLLVFAFTGEKTPLWLVILNLVFLGSGLALFSSPNSNAVMGSVTKQFYGVASSSLGTMRLVGQTVSMAIVTLIMAIYIGNVELNNAAKDLLVTSSRVSFGIFTVLCVGGIFASLARGNIHRKKVAE